MRRVQPVQNGLGVGDDHFTFLQGFFFSGGQCCRIDGINFLGEGRNAALFVRFAGIEGIQLTLDRHQFPVQLVVGSVDVPVLSVLVKQAQMQRRVGQALAVMLAMDGKETGGNIPHHSSGGGHPVDPAAALALGTDLPIQQKILARLVTALFQLFLHRNGDSLKGGPDTGFGGSAAHQLAAGTVAQNGVDGVNENGFARAGLAGEDIETGGEGHLGLFNDRHIFNFQACQHG